MSQARSESGGGVLTADASGLTFAVVEGGEALEAQRPDIVALFRETFRRSYPSALWDHYYRDLPCGDAAGITVRAEGRLVGFAGLLPQELVDADATLRRYGLFVAAMIAPRHREGGLTYLSLIRRLRDLARARRMEWILAFPNAQAWQPLIRLGGFTLLDEAVWVEGGLREAGYGRFLDAQCRRGDLTEAMWVWRLSRFDYRVEDGVMVKDFKGRPNFLDVMEAGAGAGLRGVFPWWLSAGPSPHVAAQDGVVRLCWLPLAPDADGDWIRRSVLLSDVY